MREPKNIRCAAICLFLILGTVALGARSRGGGDTSSEGGTGGVVSPPVVASDMGHRFEAVWSSVSLTAVQRNPAISSGPEPKGVDRTMSISADLHIVDANNLVGMSQGVEEASARDDLGNTYHMLNKSPFARYYSGIRTMRRINPDCRPIPGEDSDCERYIEELQPEHVSIRFDVDPNQGYPTLLRELSWTSYVVLAKYYSQVDVPFVAGDDWYELACGFRVRIDSAVSENGRYSYQMSMVTDDDNDSASGRLPNLNELPKVHLERIQFLDGNGQAVLPGSSGSSIRGLGGESRRSGSGSCSQCGDVTTVRFYLARDLYEAPASFTLKEIPIPTF